MVLRHRDRELLRFEWNGLEGVRIVSVNEAEKKFLPLEMRGEATDDRLWDWLRHRILPKHRQCVHYALEKLGIEYNVRSIITVSKGLSLNDVTDRHLGNFGYLVDNDTNTIIGPSPIFDNGYGLFALAMDRPGSPWHEFDDLRKYIKKTGPALYLKWAGEGGRKMGHWRVLK